MKYFEWGCDCGNKGCPECDPTKRTDDSKKDKNPEEGKS